MPKKAAPRPADTYVRTPDFSSRLVDLKLPTELWAVFALTDQPITAEKAALTLALDPEVTRAALRSLTRRKLLQKHLLGWHDYVATTATPTLVPAAPTPTAAAPVSPAPACAPAAPAVAVARPEAFSPAPALLAPASVSGPARPTTHPILSVTLTQTQPLQFALRNSAADARRRAADSQVIRFNLKRPPTAPPAPNAPATPLLATDSGAWKLRPILDSIVKKGGGGLPGQLLAYRVFFGIPADVTAAVGIHSLNLVNADFTVTDPRFKAALVAAVRTIAGLEIAAAPDA
jgi:hypothetical protein